MAATKRNTHPTITDASGRRTLTRVNNLTLTITAPEGGHTFHFTHISEANAAWLAFAGK